MSNLKKDLSMNDFLDDIEKSFKPIHQGDLIKGRIITIHDDGLIVNINYMYDGLIPLEEVSYDKNIDIRNSFKIGEEIDVMVIKNTDGEGHVLLSKNKADRIVAWDNLEKIHQNSKRLNITIKEVVKGGVIGYFQDIRIFIPASQLSLSYINDLNNFIGRFVEAQIIEFNKETKKVVASVKLIEEENKRKLEQNLIENFKVGEIRKGIIKKLAKFGAFVDLGGIDGLIHLNDLSWKRIIKPDDVVSIGDEVEVYILAIDKGSRKVSLSLKNTIKNPWDIIAEKYKIGNIYEGSVIKFAKFGAFVELEDGIEGLVHLDEISNDYTSKPEEKIKIGEKIKVKIIDIQNEKRKISLSIKDAMDNNTDIERYNDSSDLTLGDLLSEKFKNIKFD